MEDAEITCNKLGGQLEELPQDVPSRLDDLLYLWRNDDVTGHVRIGSRGATCRILKVTRHVAKKSRNVACRKVCVGVCSVCV